MSMIDTLANLGPQIPEQRSVRGYQSLNEMSEQRNVTHNAETAGEMRQRIVETAVTFKRLSTKELDGYLATDEWQDKAGAYAIQGLAAKFVRSLNGSYSNVVGLPLFETSQLLSGLGYDL